MSVNEFEKQVQQQLDRFQLTPSASVWQKVEEEIREKKRRRVIFFILIPAVLALLAFSIYQFWYTGKKTQTVQPSLTSTKKELPPTATAETPAETDAPSVTATEKGSTTTDELTQNTTPKNTIKENKAEEKDHLDEDAAQKEKATAKKQKTSVKTEAIFSETNAVVRKTNNTEPVKNKKTPVKTQKDNDNILVIISDAPSIQKNTVPDNSKTVPATTDPKDLTIQAAVPVIKGAQVPSSTDKDAVEAKKDSVKTDEVTSPEAKKEAIAKKKNPSKIKWGVDLSAGRTFNNSGTLTFSPAAAFDMNYNNPGSVTGVGSSSPSNPSQVIIPPSTVKPGLSFRLGIVAEKKISKRSSFSAGLQYAYSSNRIKIGTAIDTAVVLQSNSTSNFSQTRVNVDKLYSGAPQDNHTNSYHFIQIPISYYWQVNKSSKFPIRLNTTVSIGYLLNSNALLYDGALGGIYYRDKKAYNKMHFNLGAGLSFGWNTKNEAMWTIGPDLSFDMSRLVKNDQQYLMFAGINTKWYFPKKKNK